MSQDNVGVVQALFEAWNRADMDALRELWHPDVIVHPAEGWPEPGPFVGREAVLLSFEQLREAWAADTLEPVSDLIDVADRVVVRTVWQGEGHGPDMKMEVTQVFTICTAQVVAMDSFWDHAEALAAVGLSE